MAKHILPLGDRILVRRKKVGEKLGKEGLLLASDSIKERETDLAVVVYIPEHSFTDKELIENASGIVSGLTRKAAQGDSEALIALLRYNEFLKIKAIQIGDEVMISQYVGTTFHDNEGSGDLTLVNSSDVIGMVVKDD